MQMQPRHRDRKISLFSRVFASPILVSPTLFVFLALLVLNAGAAEFHYNHIGFRTDQVKRVVLSENFSLENTQVGDLQIVPVTGSASVHTTSWSAQTQVTEWNNQKYYRSADFSDFTSPGTWRLQTTVQGNTIQSQPFTISDSLYLKSTFNTVLQFFRQSRADDAAVWSADQSLRKIGDYSNTTYDVRGGWYDASGDISKYLSHLSFGNFTNPQQIPMTAWALAWWVESQSSWLQSQNLLQNVQDEAAWGGDYLVRALDPEGYFYINVFDVWNGELSNRRICAFEGSDGIRTAEYQAAWREGAGMSIASLALLARLNISGDFSAAEYLSAAETAWDHLNAQSGRYADDGKENIIDDYTALMAAVELYKATGDAGYLTAARTRAENLNQRMTTAGYFIADDGTRPFWHAAEAGLPLIALTRYAMQESDATRVQAVKSTLRANLNYQLTVAAEVSNPYNYARQTVNSNNQVLNTFFIPHDNETGYWWQGESARLASLTAGIWYSGFFLDGNALPEDYRNHALRQMDWILGSNPYDVSFLSGFGRNNPPNYGSGKPPYHGHLDGGISNGITGGQNQNTGGIDWNPSFPALESWKNWRWVEQWLPHSTWYLLALGMTHPNDEFNTGVRKNSSALSSAMRAITWARTGNVLEIHGLAISKHSRVSLHAADGTLLSSATMDSEGVARLQIGDSSHNLAFLSINSPGGMTFSRSIFID